MSHCHTNTHPHLHNNEFSLESGSKNSSVNVNPNTFNLISPFYEWVTVRKCYIGIFVFYILSHVGDEKNKINITLHYIRESKNPDQN